MTRIPTSAAVKPMSGHTELPWRNIRGCVISDVLPRDGSHADLVKALEKIGKQLTMGELIAEYGEDYLGDPEAGYDAIIMVARAALATLTARKVG